MSNIHIITWIITNALVLLMFQQCLDSFIVIEFLIPKEHNTTHESLGRKYVSTMRVYKYTCSVVIYAGNVSFTVTTFAGTSAL
jgi:hypothetical protein